MAEFVEVMKQKNRMCGTYEICNECPMHKNNNGENMSCSPFFFSKPEVAEGIIMKWTSEHLIKTNADKFREVFGFEFVSPCVALSACDGECEGCQWDDAFWDKEYIEPKEQKE